MTWRSLAAVATGLVVLAPVAALAQPAPSDVEPIDLGGTPVAASSNPGDPTVLTAGLWSNTLSGPGGAPANAHQYEYRRRLENSTVLVGVTGLSSEQSSDAIRVRAATPGGDPCRDDQGNSSSPTTHAAFGAVVVVTSSSYGDADSVCRSADVLAIQVDRGSSTLGSDLPYTIRIVEEAPVEVPEEDLPPFDDEPAAVLPQPGDPQDQPGAASFDDAPDVGTGTYAGAVREGTERLYRVRLGWGQRMAVRVDVPAQEELDNNPGVDLTLFDPMHNAFNGTVGETDEGGYYSSEPDTLYSATPAVAYLARFAGDDDVTVPGDYFVSVAVEPARDREPVEVPIELSIEVTGEPAAAPPHRENVASPGGGAGPDGYDPSTPFLVGPDEFAAEISDAPRVTSDDAASAGSGDGVRRTSGLVVGGLSLVSLAAGVVLLRRRRLP